MLANEPYFDRRGYKTRLLLESHLRRLNEVVANCTADELVLMARRYARQISQHLESTDAALHANRGMFGPNGIGPAVDSIVRQAARVAPVRLVEAA